MLALLAFGVAATNVDLLLLAHYEDVAQWTPLVLSSGAMVVIGWHAAAGSVVSVRALQLMMVGFVAAGLVGVVLHYRGNMEFQLEINPEQSAWELFSRVMTAKAPPALAPGAMAQLGLLGLLSTYRHPALRHGSAMEHTTGREK